MVIKKKLNGSGVCAREVDIIIQNGVVNGCNFIGGCDGQGKSLNALIAGMPADWVIERLRNIQCGKKQTSCAAELANAIKEALNDGV